MAMSVHLYTGAHTQQNGHNPPDSIRTVRQPKLLDAHLKDGMGCHYYPLDPFGSHATSRGPQQAKNLEFQTEAPPHPSPIPWGNDTIRVATRRQATPNEASQPTKHRFSRIDKPKSHPSSNT